MGVSPSVLCAADRQRRWIVEALPIGAAGVAPDRAVVVAFVQFHGAGRRSDGFACSCRGASIADNFHGCMAELGCRPGRAVGAQLIEMVGGGDDGDCARVIELLPPRAREGAAARRPFVTRSIR